LAIVESHEKKLAAFPSIFLVVIKSHKFFYKKISSFGRHQIPRKKLVAFSFLLIIVKSHKKTCSHLLILAMAKSQEKHKHP